MMYIPTCDLVQRFGENVCKHVILVTTHICVKKYFVVEIHKISYREQNENEVNKKWYTFIEILTHLNSVYLKVRIKVQVCKILEKK